MDGRIRATLTVVAIVQAVLGLLFIVRSPLVTGSLWPFEGMTPLSWMLLGSFSVAAAASTMWCVLAGSERGLVGIALDYLAIFLPFSILALAAMLAGAERQADLAPLVVASGLSVVAGVAILRWAIRRPWRDPRPMPRPVVWSFGVFVVALVTVGGLLVLQVPSVMPWQVTPELSRLFGFLFLGAAAYFAFGLVEPRWENAGGQLAGFLAYDVVLVIPLIQRLPAVPQELMPNLVVYIGVVVASGLLAIWYLLVDRSTRLGLARDPRWPSS